MKWWGSSGKTKVCGVIGDPIEHTMSPVMHNAAFKNKGVDYVYLPFRVKKEELGKAIEGMRALNIRGLNVTIPHKVAVIPFLDELDPLAAKIGAINTIVNDDGVLKGYNTDATGFLQALLERGIEPKGKNVVILGAGGASRAISFSLNFVLSRICLPDLMKESTASGEGVIFPCFSKSFHGWNIPLSYSGMPSRSMVNMTAFADLIESHISVRM
jgi:shikimate 5-dehydrogenase